MVTANDKFSERLLTAILLVATVLILLGLWMLFSSKTKTSQTQSAKQAVAVVQQWQLCWEKIPGARGTTNIRSQCFSAQILRDSTSLILTYPYNNGKGVMEAKSKDGTIYDGLWKDPGGWGNFHFRFTSPTSAVGWVDEKGKNPINLWLSPSK